MPEKKIRIEYRPNPEAPLAGLLCHPDFEYRLLYLYSIVPIPEAQKTAILEWANRQPSRFIGFYPE